MTPSLQLDVKPLTSNLLPDVLRLDRECFGGLWAEEAYRREIESPNSALLVLEATTVCPSSSGLPEILPSASLSSASTTTDSKNRSAEAITILGIGCVWFILEEAHITLLGIDPSYQRKRLGTFMLAVLLKCAVERGAAWATLEVRSSNYTAQALYNRIGFVKVGRRKRYYQDTKEDALILWHRGLQESSFLEKIMALEHIALDTIKAMGWIVRSVQY